MVFAGESKEGGGGVVIECETWANAQKKGIEEKKRKAFHSTGGEKEVQKKEKCTNVVQATMWKNCEKSEKKVGLEEGRRFSQGPINKSRGGKKERQHSPRTVRTGDLA